MAASIDADRAASAKKLQKKLNKAEKNLTSRENIEIAKNATQVLCVQNGGLGNDVSQDELLPLFETYGAVEGIIMLPRKQYCFISFFDKTTATQALNGLNGHLLRRGKDPSQDVVLYIFYVLKAPSNIMPSSEKPPGLIIVEDFITDEVEKALLREVNMTAVTNNEDSGLMKHRQVKHYGFEFKYGINDVDVNNPLPNGIPSVCHEFLERAKNLGLVQHLPDQLTVNQYKPGQGIPPHVDTPGAFEDGIMSLSLGSEVVMEFRHPDNRHLSVLVPRRSLLIMTGESRYVWSHGITPRKSDIVMTPSGDGLTLQNRGTRTSFTFRKVVFNRNLPSESNCKAAVDSKTLPETDKEAIVLEQQHVHKVYNNIADHFSGTRYKPWPRVVDFLMDQPPMSLLADVGCGNGKCLGVNKELFEIGSDYSSNLASICHSRGFETCVADVTCLPFRSNSFDVVLCIAVIHHMATKARRHKAVSEVVRILCPGGKALIYVWAMEQDYEKSSSNYINPNKQKKQSEYDSMVEEDGAREEKQSTLDNSQSEKIFRDDECKTREECRSKFQDFAENHGSCEQADPSPALEQKQNAVASSVKNDNSEHPPEISQLSLDPDTGACPASCDLQTRCKSDSSAIHQISVRHKDSEQEHIQMSGDCSMEDSGTNYSKKLHVHVNRTQFKEQDLLVPWQLKSKQPKSDTLEVETQDDKPQLFHRFYHVFRQGELEAVCKKVSSCVVRKSYYDQGNWCVVLEKV